MPLARISLVRKIASVKVILITQHTCDVWDHRQWAYWGRGWGAGRPVGTSAARSTGMQADRNTHLLISRGYGGGVIYHVAARGAGWRRGTWPQRTAASLTGEEDVRLRTKLLSVSS